MRFTAYDIYEQAGKKIKRINSEDKEKLLKALRRYPKKIIEKNSYAPVYIHEDEEYILGTLAQSYYTILTKFDTSTADTKDEVVLDDNEINDKTYFYLSCVESRIYIQGKRYPAALSKKVTVERIKSILEECFNCNIIFIPAKIDYTIEEIDEIFHSSFVKSISFRNLNGLKIPEGASLHNPKKYLDEALIESYNIYSAPTLSSMDLKAQSGEELSKNPFAKIGMILSKKNRQKNIFKNMEIIEDGQTTQIKPGGNEHKVIYVPKKDLNDSYETYDRIMKKVSKTYKGRFEE